MPYQSGTNAGAGVSVGTNGINICEHGNGYLTNLLAYNAAISDTTFTHVTVVYNNKQPSLYLNGYLVATGLTSTRPNVYPSIGSDGNGGYGPYIGQLDNIRIWGGALNAAEVISVMEKADATVAGKTLIARYTFNGGSRLDDKGAPAQPAWTSTTSTPMQTHYTYTWSGTGAVPVASGNERQTSTAALGTTRYWVTTKQGSCETISDTMSVTTDAVPGGTISGNAVLCQNATEPLIRFTGSGSTAAYTFTYSINGGDTQTITTSAHVPIRYIRIKQNGTTSDHYLHLAELRAIQLGTGTNVALGKGGNANSTNPSFPVTNLTDGNVNNYWHSQTGGSNEYVQIDLGAGYILDHIELINRQDCCWPRATNLQMVLSDPNGVQHSSSPVNAYQNQNNGYASSWQIPAGPYVTLPARTTTPGNFKYKLINVQNRHGCPAPANDSITVAISAAPTVSISPDAGTSICAGTAVTITATAGNVTTPSYQWYRNGINAGTAMSYASNALINGDSISLKVTTTGVCASSPANSYVKLKVHALPDATISGSSCTNSPLAAIITQPTAVLQWKTGSNVLQTKAAAWAANGITVAGGSNGSALNQFNSISRPFVDAAGNIYVPDAGNHRVVKWAPGASAGVIVAGGNGAGAAANQLNMPAAVYTDAAQNIYVADFGNQRVQKWAAGATTGTTVAGITGSAGNSNNRLREPIAITMDASGNLYITECFNHRVSKWAPGATEGITVAGKAAGILGTDSASLSYPLSTCLDAAGNIYIADNSNNRVVKWAPGATSGTVVAGGNGAGNGANQLNTPADVYIDGTGNLYIADQNNHRIQRWMPGSNTATTVSGTGSIGNTAMQLHNPSGILLDAAGSMYIADNLNNRVQKFILTKDTTYTPLTAGSYTVMATSLAGCSTTSAGSTVHQSAEISTAPAASNHICSANPLMLSVTASHATSYQWRKDGVNIPSANTSVYSKSNSAAGDAGIYKVIAISGNGCNDTSAGSTVNITAMNTSLPVSSTTTNNLHTDGLQFSYTDPACRPIVNIADAGGGNVLGAIQIALTIDTMVNAYRGQPYLQRHYDLQPASDGPATVTLYATQAEFDAYNNYITSRSMAWPLLPAGPSDAGGKANLSITQYHGAPGAGTTGPGGQYNVSQGVLIPNNLITTSWNGNYWELSFPVSGFSGFFITTGSNTPLPVDLKDISARNVGDQNEVSWSTVSEDMGDYFEVERSFDARHFTYIGQLNGRSANGSNYVFTDKQPGTGSNYYRLKMIDAAGQHHYSRIVQAMVKGGRLTWEAYPNPAKDKVAVRIHTTISGRASISIIDVSGKRLREVSLSGTETSIPVSDLPGGIYLLRYQDDQHLEHIKIHKQ